MAGNRTLTILHFPFFLQVAHEGQSSSVAQQSACSKTTRVFNWLGCQDNRGAGRCGVLRTAQLSQTDAHPVLHVPFPPLTSGVQMLSFEQLSQGAQSSASVCLVQGMT